MEYCQEHGVIKERLEDGTHVCRWCRREEYMDELVGSEWVLDFHSPADGVRSYKEEDSG